MVRIPVSIANPRGARNALIATARAAGEIPGRRPPGGAIDLPRSHAVESNTGRRRADAASLAPIDARGR